MIDKQEKSYQEFGEFVRRFVGDLNHFWEGGWSLLVEGQRDARALRALGYKGSITTSSSLAKQGKRAFSSDKVIVLTDLDREGGVLAARFVKKLGHEGMKVSLAERRRLRLSSKGVFLHIENLSRFVDIE